MKALFAMTVFGMLTACSQGSENGETAEDFAQRAGVGAPAQAAAPQLVEVNAQPIVAPTGVAQLMPLSADAPKALGRFKGGCSFAYQSRSLLVVRPPVTAGGNPEGVLVIDGEQIILPGTAPIETGPTLSGAGHTVRVLRAEGIPQSVNCRREWAADLVISGPRGETRFSPGTWSCTS